MIFWEAVVRLLCVLWVRAWTRLDGYPLASPILWTKGVQRTVLELNPDFSQTQMPLDTLWSLSIWLSHRLNGDHCDLHCKVIKSYQDAWIIVVYLSIRGRTGYVTEMNEGTFFFSATNTMTTVLGMIWGYIKQPPGWRSVILALISAWMGVFLGPLCTLSCVPWWVGLKCNKHDGFSSDCFPNAMVWSEDFTHDAMQLFLMWPCDGCIL